MATEIQSLIDHLKDGKAPWAEVAALLDHPAAVVRANALEAVVQVAAREPGAIQTLVAAATDPKNSTRLMGTITLAHLAVACLLKVRTPQAVAAAGGLIQSWAGSDRKDLLWYLESEGLGAGTSESGVKT